MKGILFLVGIFAIFLFLPTVFGATPITNCGTISSSGSYYLANNITGLSGSSCLGISGNNIYVDLNGNTILMSSGDMPFTSYPLALSTANNVTVVNGNALNSFGSGGIVIENVENGIIRNILTNGISIFQSRRIQIYDMTNIPSLATSFTPNWNMIDFDCSIVQNITIDPNSLVWFTTSFLGSNGCDNTSFSKINSGVSISSSVTFFQYTNNTWFCGNTPMSADFGYNNTYMQLANPYNCPNAPDQCHILSIPSPSLICDWSKIGASGLKNFFLRTLCGIINGVFGLSFLLIALVIAISLAIYYGRKIAR
jgi:hypothetical protein